MNKLRWNGFTVSQKIFLPKAQLGALCHALHVGLGVKKKLTLLVAQDTPLSRANILKGE